MAKNKKIEFVPMLSLMIMIVAVLTIITGIYLNAPAKDVNNSLYTLLTLYISMILGYLTAITFSKSRRR